MLVRKASFLLLLGIGAVMAFTTRPALIPLRSRAAASRSGVMRFETAVPAPPEPDSMADRFFQLQEMEDKETCTTEIFLHADATITVGETDGPVFVQASGQWAAAPDGSLKMVITRTYEAGKEKQQDTDVGEFEFTVDRTFLGQFAKVGAEYGFQGSMHHFEDNGNDQEVGYFTMIDTTKAKLGQEEPEGEAILSNRNVEG